MLSVFALTCAAIVGWFVVVFRQLLHRRRLAMVAERFSAELLGMAGIFRQLGVSCAEATAAFVAFGASVRESVAQMEAALSPKQREIYDELRGIGVYPLDAMHEACARWPD